MIESIIEGLKEIMTEELDVNLQLEEIDENAPLLEGGLGIDSIAIVRLISFCEDQFDIQFSDQDLIPENFTTLTILANLIMKRKSMNA